MTTEEKVLKCGNWRCSDEVRGCDQCGKAFKVGQKIFCFEYGHYHFCSEDCMESFLDDEAIETEVLLENED